MNHNPLEELIKLLRTLFQFDSAELDFGIYRIMNHKRKEIENFIEKDLIQAVKKEFERYKTQSGKELLEKIDEKGKEIKQLEKELGEQILKNGKIEEKFKDKPFAKEYLEFKKQYEDLEITTNIQAQVFNDLYNFFSRYYEDGDFISKRRYSSKQHKYAIPYDGEEVKLYWANFDQYYIKTGEVFKDYKFILKDWKITFRAVIAEVETGNIKGEKRYFVLHSSEPIKINKEEKTCLIQFEYKQLTDEDLSKYAIKTKSGEEKKTGIKQDELNAILKDKILSQIKEVELKAFLSEYEDVIAIPSKAREKQSQMVEKKTIFGKHLYKYTRKITSDFFIHKNLKGFLERELDYFIKTEVIDLNNLEPRHITRAKVVEGIGKWIIEFLHQIEEFQKMLWEKKKFVLKTDYVITTDRIPEEFHKEIFENKAQLKEWQGLGFEIPSESLRGTKSRSNLKLPIDTKYFSEDFKEKLLEKLTSPSVIARSVSDEAISKTNKEIATPSARNDTIGLDDLIDGILIKSENYQALNLILNKYRENVQCIYIDPPYNTGSDEFMYKDKYRHSSWLAMMENRLRMINDLSDEKGIIFISIDDHEKANLEKLLDFQLKEDNLIGPIIVQVNKGGRDYLPIAKQQEYVICAYIHSLVELTKERETTGFKYTDLKGKWYPRELRNRNPKFNKQNRPNLYYSFFIDPHKKNSDGFCPVSLKRTGRHSIEIVPLNSKGEDSCWRWNQSKVSKCLDSNNPEKSDIVARQKSDGGWNIYEKYRGSPYKARTLWLDSKYRTENGSIQLRHMFGRQLYDFPKPVDLIEDLFDFSTENEVSLILDFFAGSGTTAHAVMKINNEDGGKRRYILVEMADYFDTIILPRLKKVCYSFNWKEGKPQDTDGISQIIKYHYLEQYEDTLHNIEFLNEEKGKKAMELFEKGNSRNGKEQMGNDYLMEYMLKYETEGSASLLNLQQFENPFEYKLKIISNKSPYSPTSPFSKGRIGGGFLVEGELKGDLHNVDLVETFNYLIGLKVNKYKFFTDEIATHPSGARNDKGKNGRKYVFVLGERNNRKVAVVWRMTKGIDLEKDKEVIEKTIGNYEPDEIYINGDAFYPKGYKVIETEFKALMGV